MRFTKKGKERKEG
uniref:Uncharacterized protein n=1 Tax=Rhizophora mucronata TaxID=61149 RepID=A0A2P2MKR3_RHIMU